MNELLAKYPAVLDVATVAEILEVTPATVRRLLKANVIPSVKVGRLTLQGLHCKYICLLNKAFSLNSYYTHMEAFRISGMPGIHIYRSISGCPHFGIYNSFLRRTHLHKRDAVHTVLQICSPFLENSYPE